MSTASRAAGSADAGGPADVADYCRRIEAYLCQKNDGHLIRVVGPSFDLVSCWAVEGIPLKVAYAGIDRYCERYYRAGPRRRPVRIDFCANDVRDAFDDWRRATGVTAATLTASPGHGAEPDTPSRRTPSLTDHLTRVVARLTDARVAGTLSADADPLIDRISHELTVAQASPRGLRGDAREALLARLEHADRELLAIARASLGPALAQLTEEAERELGSFRAQLTPEALAHARELAIARLIRERCRLPVVTLA
jgi:hypothetical protein